MTLPKAEEFLKGFSTGKSEETPQEYLASLMKEYTRQVLDYAAKKVEGYRDESIILKIKDEL